MTTDRAGAGSGPLAEPDISAWVGDQALSIVPAGDSEPWGWDLVAYDPADDIWRTIEQNRYDQLPTDELVPIAGAAPIHHPFAAASWDGELVVVGWRSDLGTMGWARLDPVTATWSSFNPITGSDDVYGIRHAPGSPAIIDDRYLVLMTSGQITDYPFGYRIDLTTDDSIVLDAPVEVGAFILSISLADDGTIVGVHSDESGQSTRFATRLDAATGTFTPLATPRSGPVEEQASLVALPGGYALLEGSTSRAPPWVGCARRRSTSPPARQSNADRPAEAADRPRSCRAHRDLDRRRDHRVGRSHARIRRTRHLATIPLRDGALYRPSHRSPSRCQYRARREHLSGADPAAHHRPSVRHSRTPRMAGAGCRRAVRQRRRDRFRLGLERGGVSRRGRHRVRRRARSRRSPTGRAADRGGRGDRRAHRARRSADSTRRRLVRRCAEHVHAVHDPRRRSGARRVAPRGTARRTVALPRARSLTGSRRGQVAASDRTGPAAARRRMPSDPRCGRVGECGRVRSRSRCRSRYAHGPKPWSWFTEGVARNP